MNLTDEAHLCAAKAHLYLRWLFQARSKALVFMAHLQVIVACYKIRNVTDQNPLFSYLLHQENKMSKIFFVRKVVCCMTTHVYIYTHISFI